MEDKSGCIEGVLEIDNERGVIYFHTDFGATLLRICGLPKPIPNCKFIDITHAKGVSYQEEEISEAEK